MENNPNIINRDLLVDSVKAELMGPWVVANAIPTDCSLPQPRQEENPDPKGKPYSLEKRARVDVKTRQEILYVPPSADGVYGVGVLYPNITKYKEGSIEDAPLDSAPDEELENVNLGEFEEDLESKDIKITTSANEEDADDNIPTYFSNKSSSMGLSFLIEENDDAHLEIKIEGARYKPIEMMWIDLDGNPDKSSESDPVYWIREVINEEFLTAKFECKEFSTEDKTTIDRFIYVRDENNNEVLTLKVMIKSRKLLDQGRLLTVAVTNETNPIEHVFSGIVKKSWKHSYSQDHASLFQSGLSIRCTDSKGHPLVKPYPERNDMFKDDIHANFDQVMKEELDSLDLLYRDYKTYASGHGCAATWDEPDYSEAVDYIPLQEELRVSVIRGEMIPVYEVPNITPNIYDELGNQIRVRMVDLAGITSKSLDECLAVLLQEYQKWIDSKRSLISNLEERHRDAALRHLKGCEKSLQRIKSGIEFIKSDPTAYLAFKMANEAMMRQQIAGKGQARTTHLVDGKYQFSPEQMVNFDNKVENQKQESINNLESESGIWRPFQIAFILSNLRGSVSTEPVFMDERKEVDLIWFPTGGGKTEAYLGLAAFVIFHRRLVDNKDIGVQVLMRYTLRLLTAQQFQRASALLCAMEWMRNEKYSEELGTGKFSIGVWLGSDITPNRRKTGRNNANESYQRLLKGNSGTPNPFLLEKCPWCKAEIGMVSKKKMSKDGTLIDDGHQLAGYIFSQSIEYQCPDKDCYFNRDRKGKKLPVYVVDEDVYSHRPDILIATVDKFASLSWREDIRSVFGIDAEGNRFASPPGLIIQDELHLISGPLGSIVGLYEPLIQDLCTNKEGVPAKIVASTATIRRYEQQISALYDREKVNLFPSPGIQAKDSFFAQLEIDSKTNRPTPGKKYMGIYPTGISSQQKTEARVYAPLLQFSCDTYDRKLDEHQKDPWWTLLVFYNSIRELANAQSIFNNDVKIYQSGKYYEKKYQNTRYAQVVQLTGGQASSEVTTTMNNLEKVKGVDEFPVDVCQATSIIEVGIDIDRLSLMCVVGHPKTTSQYIQVTGRVGRRADRPGLVTTVYKASNPRNRSIFENFQSYHSKLYMQVEPISVTPLAGQVIEKCLAGLIFAYVRNHAPYSPNKNVSTDVTLWKGLTDDLRNILKKKAEYLASKGAIQEEEKEDFINKYDKIIEEWERAKKPEWGQQYRFTEAGMMYPAGQYVPSESLSVMASSPQAPDRPEGQWPVQSSMRTVDKSALISIKDYYRRAKSSISTENEDNKNRESNRE